MNRPNIKIKYNRSKEATPSRRSLSKRVGLASVAAILLASGTYSPAIAEVDTGKRLALGGQVSLNSEEKLLAVAPTLAVTVLQSSAKYADESVTLTLGFARTETTAASDWTQSPSNTDEYYYNGTYTGFSTNTMYNDRAIIENTKSRSGTIGSLPIGAAVVGDNDSLGADTLYVRLYDSLAPADNEVIVVWDETDIGSNYFSRCDIEWWLDRTDSATDTAVDAWELKYRHCIDPRSGNTIDMAGMLPTASEGSPMRGPFYSAVLPTGTLQIKCRVTNEDGLSTTTTTAVTTGSTARTEKTVQAVGGDYTSLLTAVNAASNGWRITVEGGHTEDLVGDKLNLSNHQGVSVEWDGVGSKPVITTTDKLFQINNAEGSLVYGIEGDPNGTTSGPFAEFTKTQNLAVINCDFGGDATNYFTDGVKQSVFNATEDALGLLVMNNTAGHVGAYVVGSATANAGRFMSDMMMIGNDFRGYDGTDISNNESAIRDASSYTSWCVMYNYLAENSKSAIRQTNMDHSLVFGNRMGPDGDVWVGNSGSNYHLAFNVRIDSNLIIRNAGGATNQAVDIKQGAIGITICNNIILIDAGFNALSGADFPGSSTVYYAGYAQHKDILFVHNTVQLTSGAGNADILKLTGRATATYTTGCAATQNVLVTHVGHSGSDIITSTGWTSTGNDTGEDTLDSIYQPSTLTLSTGTTYIGVTYDFWGNVRPATSEHGAVVGSPPDILTDPATVSTIPADDDTGVATGANITFQFNQEMKANSGTTELRRVSDDVAVATVVAGDLLINSLDKTEVTWTSLTMPEDTALYVYMPAGVLLGLMSDVAFPGILNNTTLNFNTAGGSSGALRKAYRMYHYYKR